MMSDNVGRAEIRSYAERIIRLDDERQTLVDDIREIRAECKSRGFNVKALNAAIKRYRMTGEEREQFDLFEEETHLYFEAISGADE
jgi:uncharacterized protein (UPF0335 family)